MKKKICRFIWLLVFTFSFFTPIVNTNASSYLKFEELKSTTVYITKTGKKYHKGNCTYLRQSKIGTTKKEAIHNGYTACSRCKP